MPCFGQEAAAVTSDARASNRTASSPSGVTLAAGSGTHRTPAIKITLEMKMREDIIGSLLGDDDRIRQALPPKKPMFEPTRTARAVWIGSLILGAAAIAEAQFDQYTSPGSLANEVNPRRQRIEEGWEDAHWDFGNLRLDPRFEIRDLGYVDNVLSDFEGEEQVSDTRATVGAGLAAYWRAGNNLYATAFVAPQYNWWLDLDSLRGLSVSGGVGVHAFFNQLTFSIDGRTVEQEQPLNAEFEVPVEIKDESLGASLELDLSERLSLVVGASTTETRHGDEIDALVEGFEARSLDRDVDRLRAGIGLALGSLVEIVLGVEDLQTDFLVDPAGRSSSGTDPFVDLRFEGNRLSAAVSSVIRNLDFAAAADPALGDPASFEDTTGSLRIGIELSQNSTFYLYGGSTLVYSALEDSTYLSEERLGGKFQVDLRSRLRSQLIAEFGDNEYTGLQDELDRLDDFRTLGANLVFELGPSSALRFEVSETRYDSNQPEFDRSATRISIELVRGSGIIPY